MKKILMALTFMAAFSSCDDRTAEQIGKDLAQEKVDIVKGVGEVVKDQGGGVADTVAQGVGNVLLGLNKGFDESLQQKEVRVDDALQSLVTVSRAEQIEQKPGDTRTGMSLYIISETGVNQKTQLLAFAGGAEVGRSSAEINIEEQGSSYVDFEFDERTPFSTVDYYLLK